MLMRIIFEFLFLWQWTENKLYWICRLKTEISHKRLLVKDEEVKKRTKIKIDWYSLETKNWLGAELTYDVHSFSDLRRKTFNLFIKINL